MKNPDKPFLFLILVLLFSVQLRAQSTIYVNQVAYETLQPKKAIFSTEVLLPKNEPFSVIDIKTGKSCFTGQLGKPILFEGWTKEKKYYQLDFTAFRKTGAYQVVFGGGKIQIKSPPFQITPSLAALTLPAILHYFRKQRANTALELKADQTVQLYGSDERVDLRGGWCDASGDVSKYFSHLAYANFVSPQQIPLVTWSLVNTAERVPKLLKKLQLQDSIADEALWGADYLMRSLSKNDYFYMIVFSYFNKDPNARRVVGLHANSVTTNEYQCAFREGAGMAIAALARISRWHKNGDYTAAQYLDGAKRAFAHLLLNNTKYTDDGKDNIIDDYCALMAATELWISTSDPIYREEARKRAANLEKRITPKGYFIDDDGDRPFWHAADAGLPVVALSRYLEVEQDSTYRKRAIEVIRKNLNYTLAVTSQVANPFGYARQTFRFRDQIQDGFFIPHENETGWWWQGENARLASLATAALVGGRLTAPADRLGISKSLSGFAAQQISWILGANPYSTCFMYGFGQNNVPYMHSNYGHGSERGGISNGITGKDGAADGSGIDFKREAGGNEWRWTEQWLPHAAWFLQAITAMEK